MSSEFVAKANREKLHSILSGYFFHFVSADYIDIHVN